ncbi:hypothetical protein MMC22_009154 [Lobaria immixta]|nr:hypothetical protein [Lobaria immixta]
MFCKNVASLILLGAIGVGFAHGAPPRVRRACTPDFLEGTTCDDTYTLNTAPGTLWSYFQDELVNTGTSGPSIQNVALLDTQDLNPPSPDNRIPSLAPFPGTNSFFDAGFMVASSDQATQCDCNSVVDADNQGCVISKGDGAVSIPENTSSESLNLKTDDLL